MKMEQQDLHKETSTNQENKWKFKKAFMEKEPYNLNNHIIPPIHTDKHNMQCNNNNSVNNNNQTSKYLLAISKCPNNNVRISSFKFNPN